MNKAYDYNGTIISPSKPSAKLTTLRRVVHLDSGDRDIIQYPTNGDIVLYLPRTYEKVVGIRVKGAEFPALFSGAAGTGGTGGTSATITFIDPNGNIIGGAISTTSNYYTHIQGTPIGSTYDSPLKKVTSLFLDIENLNRSDETAPRHQRSSFTDSTFAKFQLPANTTEAAIYNESSSMHNETYYTPPLGKLDRLHLTLRTHQQKNTAYIYSSGGTFGVSGSEYSLTLEIETLENSFDDYSSIETRVSERTNGYWNSSS
jgi:hypothetical protein